MFCSEARLVLTEYPFVYQGRGRVHSFLRKSSAFGTLRAAPSARDFLSNECTITKMIPFRGREVGASLPLRAWRGCASRRRRSSRYRTRPYSLRSRDRFLGSLAFGSPAALALPEKYTGTDLTLFVFLDQRRRLPGRPGSRMYHNFIELWDYDVPIQTQRIS